MVNFDSALPGTAAEVWAADGRLASIPPLELGAGDRVMVIAAHPDDETLGAGGLISECFLQGIAIQTVIVTDGAASHATSTESERTALADRRAEEARAAVEILAPESALTLLALPDGGVREHTEQLYDALATLVENSPGTTVLVAPWRGDGHRDHRVVGEVCASLAASRGIRLIEYPIWLWHWSTPDNAATPWGAFNSLALRPQSVAAKRRAIAAYTSQITATAEASEGADSVLHPRFLRNFGRTTEMFVTRDIVGAATTPVPGSAGGTAETIHTDTGHTVHNAASVTSASTVAESSATGTSAAFGATATGATATAASTTASSRSRSRSSAASAASSMDSAYFDAAYERKNDPWGFETRWYESRKRAVTLATLPAELYESALEIGCSIGVLTEQLATRCASILAVDISQPAVDRARSRLQNAAHVTVERLDVGRHFPERHFDLIVLSEVAYYFDLDGLDGLLEHIETSLGATGTLVVCHWRHPVAGYPLTGDEVHQAIRTRPGLQRMAAHVEEDFLLEVFSHDGRSVASRTGLR